MILDVSLKKVDLKKRYFFRRMQCIVYATHEYMLSQLASKCDPLSDLTRALAGICLFTWTINYDCIVQYHA